MSLETKFIENVLLFEISLEVMNKIGGIYTVLRTKAPAFASMYKGDYFMIGIWEQSTDLTELEEFEFKNQILLDAIDIMKNMNFQICHGKWLILGEPQVILLKPDYSEERINKFKYEFWQNTGIELHRHQHDPEIQRVLSFGHVLLEFFKAVMRCTSENAIKIIAHFHEWMSSIALILIKNINSTISTIFTTHATLLGRHLCAANAEFYENIALFDLDFEAGIRNIYPHYCIERAATHCCDVFTTVSLITAYEAEIILKRRPDGILPNGINLKTYQSKLYHFQNIHNESRLIINRIVQGHFYGRDDLNIDQTLYFFISGRNEVRNKGIDVFIDSLSNLNKLLIAENSKRAVVAFIIVPAEHSGLHSEALKGQILNRRFKEISENFGKKLSDFIYEQSVCGNLPTINNHIFAEELIELKKQISSMKRFTDPPIVTHSLKNDHTNLIIQALRKAQLFNSSTDKIKIIFHPEFINSSSPIFGMEYEKFVRGCHLGVFPSYYEPWGYTPAECIALGIPTVTTDLSGFGSFIEDKIDNLAEHGVYIVNRKNKSRNETVHQLTDIMLEFCHKSQRQRIAIRNRAERLSQILDWNNLIVEYQKAHLHAFLKNQ